MHAHVSDEGGRSQLDVLSACVGRALVELDGLSLGEKDGVWLVVFQRHFDEVSLLWQTYQALAANFEQASREAIYTIAKLEARGAISHQVADELMQPFTQALGDVYVDVMAVQPE